ncbi:MAG: sigma-70 family RNA polymerase sigma factor [Polyangiaceae bacterium]
MTVSKIAIGSTSPDRPSLAVEYRRHADFVWRSLQRLGVRSHELNDGLQEVFLVAHRRLDDFDATRAQFSTWLFGIAVRVAWSFRRRRPMQTEADLVLVDAQTPQSVYEARESVLRLHQALDELTPELRATFVLFELEGESCVDIAAMFDIPTGTVYSRLHKAREIVRARVQGTSAYEKEAL